MVPPKVNNIPSVFVIFGATGDLVEKKIFPSLFHLYCKGRLPRMLQIIGYARRDISDEDFRQFVRSSLAKHEDISAQKKNVEKFLQLFYYHQGNFDTLADYSNLAERLGHVDGMWQVCSNKLFYLAAPPTSYQPIFENLSTSGLTEPCSPEEGWTRVIVEKPFGKDLQTSEMLDSLLGKLFREEQIYRIDHYLGKEMVQNILSFRFGNTLFEEIWNNKYVEKIEVKILEKMGVGRRGDFYEGVGALRDVGQNHILQMLALATMDRPSDLSPELVRRSRSDVLSHLHVLEEDEVLENTFRGQYEGYREVAGVSKKSMTETYFKVLGMIDSPRWSGVPIILEGGKQMPEDKKEIVVTFKSSAPFFPEGTREKKFQNKVRFALDPENKISINFCAKKPGLEFEMNEKSLEFSYDSSASEFTEEYERLLLDVISGNQLLFVSTPEVTSMWSFIDPILRAWQKNIVKLHHYKKRSKKLFELTPRTYSYSTEMKAIKKREVGIIGLGKMGNGLAKRLKDYSWRVVAYNRTSEDVDEFVREGGEGAYSYGELFSKISKPRVVIVSLPALVLDHVFFESSDPLISYFEKGDIIIDAGNSYYKDTVRRGAKFEKQGITFVDVGISGGPGGARYGACLMVGGERATYNYLKPLYRDMSVNRGEEFFEGVGAGHFVKMVHNGIEYGMMQAIAEGFSILRESKYGLDLSRVASVYNHGSVIESRLVGWLQEGFELYGEDLGVVSGTVAHTGEGQWTIETAKELGVRAKIIDEALKFRLLSERNPSYSGKVLSALRNRFGGHSISPIEK